MLGKYNTRIVNSASRRQQMALAAGSGSVRPHRPPNIGINRSMEYNLI